MLTVRSFIAELIASFTLALVVLLAVSNSLTTTPALAALVVLLFVYTIGSVSGAHINPAVTMGLFSVGKISMTDAIIYIIMQFLGASLAMVIGSIFVVVPAILPISNAWSVVFVEALGAAILAFGVSSVVYKRTPEAASGIVVGGSLLLGIIIASFVSNGVINPAVAMAIGSGSMAYILSPLIGGVLGAWLGKYLYNA